MIDVEYFSTRHLDASTVNGAPSMATLYSSNYNDALDMLTVHRILIGCVSKHVVPQWRSGREDSFSFKVKAKLEVMLSVSS